MRPSTVELVGVGAVTSGSAVFLRQKQYWGRGRYQDDVDEDLESVLHNVCTVVCMQIPFCVSERASLLRNLENLVQTSSCRDAASLAAACRNAACIIEEEAGVGVFEDSRRFAPHVDVFLAQSFREAERRFSSHVKTEGAHIDKLMQYYQNKKKKLASGQVNEQDFEQGDYGVVTLVVATREGVDLRCYDDSLEDTVSCTNLRKLRRALHAVAQLKDGEAAGLEVLWVPVDETDGGMGLKQMAESYPALRLY